MMRVIRLFLFLEGGAFIAAALIHFGRLMAGYDHPKAGTAESVIGIVILIGWALTWIRPRSTWASFMERTLADDFVGIGRRGFMLAKVALVSRSGDNPYETEPSQSHGH